MVKMSFLHFIEYFFIILFMYAVALCCFCLFAVFLKLCQSKAGAVADRGDDIGAASHVFTINSLSNLPGTSACRRWCGHTSLPHGAQLQTWTAWANDIASFSADGKSDSCHGVGAQVHWVLVSFCLPRKIWIDKIFRFKSLIALTDSNIILILTNRYKSRIARWAFSLFGNWSHRANKVNTQI